VGNLRKGGLISAVCRFFGIKTAQMAGAPTIAYLRGPAIVVRMAMNANKFTRLSLFPIKAIAHISAMSDDAEIRSQIVEPIPIDMVNDEPVERSSHDDLVKPNLYSATRSFDSRMFASDPLRVFSVRTICVKAWPVLSQSPFQMANSLVNIVVYLSRLSLCKVDYLHLHIIAQGGY